MATIRDIALDEDTLDVRFEDGDLVWLEDAEVVAQGLRIRLRRIMGEWFLNVDSGVNYESQVFARGAAREAHIREKIASFPNVREISRFEATTDPANRSITVDFTVETTFGSVDVVVASP